MSFNEFFANFGHWITTGISTIANNSVDVAMIALLTAGGFLGIVVLCVACLIIVDIFQLLAYIVTHHARTLARYAMLISVISLYVYTVFFAHWFWDGFAAADKNADALLGFTVSYFIVFAPICYVVNKLLGEDTNTETLAEWLNKTPEEEYEPTGEIRYA